MTPEEMSTAQWIGEQRKKDKLESDRIKALPTAQQPPGIYMMSEAERMVANGRYDSPVEALNSNRGMLKAAAISVAKSAIKKSESFNVEYVDSYGIKLPPGYVKRGDLYVFEKPAEKAVPQDQVIEAPAEGTKAAESNAIEVLFDEETTNKAEHLRDKHDPKRRTAHVFRFPDDKPQILYRGISEQEFKTIQANKEADITGGKYSAPLEREFGAQYSLTAAEAIRSAFHDEKVKGVTGQPKYLLKVDARGKIFSHLDPRPLTNPELSKRGRYLIRADRINGNLGVSVRIPFKEVLSVESLGSVEKEARAKYEKPAEQAVPQDQVVEAPAEETKAAEKQADKPDTSKEKLQAVIPAAVAEVEQKQPELVKLRDFDNRGKLRKEIEMPPVDAARKLRARESSLKSLLDCITR